MKIKFFYIAYLIYMIPWSALCSSYCCKVFQHLLRGQDSPLLLAAKRFSTGSICRRTQVE